MDKKTPKHDTTPKDPKVPAIDAVSDQFKNSKGSTSIVPVASPWISPPD